MTTIRVQRKHLHFPVKAIDCPIFRAIDEIATGLIKVYIFSAVFNKGPGRRLINIPLPAIAQVKQLEFLDITSNMNTAFDNINEFEFDLDIPNHLLRESANLQLQEV